MILDNNIEVVDRNEKNTYLPSRKFASPNEYIYDISWMNSHIWMKHVPFNVFSTLFRHNIELVTDMRDCISWYPAIKFNDAILNFTFRSANNSFNPESRRIQIIFTLTNAGLRDVSHSWNSIDPKSQFIEFTNTDSVDLITNSTYSFMQEISDDIAYYETPKDTWGARFV